MATLQDLLASAKATVEAKAQLATTKERVKKARSTAERTEAVAESLALQATLDWRASALVYREVQWSCSCLNHGVNPDGLFLLYEHARLANSTRLARPTFDHGIPDGLPKRILTERVLVDLCPNCAGPEGFVKSYTPPVTVDGRRPVPLRAEQRVYENDWRTLTQPEEQSDDLSPDHG
jgi:hypothetical protein